MKVNSINSTNFKALNATRAAQERVIPNLSEKIVNELLAARTELQNTKNIDLELVPVDFKPMKRNFELNIAPKNKHDNPKFRDVFTVSEDSFLYTGGIPKNSMVAGQWFSETGLKNGRVATLMPEFDNPAKYEQCLKVLDDMHKNWLGLSKGEYIINYIENMTELTKLLDSAKNINTII